MDENTERLNEAHVVMEPVAIDSSAASINVASFDVEVKDPASTRPSYSRVTLEDQNRVKEATQKAERAKYFALKDGYFEKSVGLCKSELYFPEVDGEYVGAWLVTEIDHWDHEKERLLLLTDKQLIIAHFNFITTKIEDHRKIPLVNCTRIQTSNLTYSSSTFGFYPNTSTTRRQGQLGLRLYWNTARVPGTFDFWNPWSHDIPFITLMPHLSSTAVEDQDDSVPDFLSFASFEKSLVAAAASDISRALATDEEPIVIHMILGLSAVIHNQSKLGFCRDRGGVCF